MGEIEILQLEEALARYLRLAMGSLRLTLELMKGEVPMVLAVSGFASLLCRISVLYAITCLFRLIPHSCPAFVLTKTSWCRRKDMNT